MLAIPVKKTHWILSLVLSLLFLTYLGWLYSRLRAMDEMVLVPLSLSSKYGPVQSFMARQELWRKIRAGESNGADALSISLALSVSGYFDTDDAIGLADELLAEGIDIDGKTSFGFTPLHRAISANEPESVVFLLVHCADPGVPTSFGPDGTEHMNALEIAFLVEKEYPEKDFSRVIEALESWELASRCTDR